MKEKLERIINEAYIQSQMEKVVMSSKTLNIQFVDFDGGKTQWLGLNDKNTIDYVITALELRKSLLKSLK